MAELFGAPLGILAADANYRDNLIAGMKSQAAMLEAEKTRGEIVAQPAQLELVKAQARHQGTLADHNVAQTAQLNASMAAAIENKRLWALAMSQNPEVQARQEAVNAAANRGVTLTVGDVPLGGFAAQKQSPFMFTARRLDEMANHALSLGVNPIEVAKLVKDGAEAFKDSATGASAQAMTEVHQLDAIRKRSAELGAAAGYGKRGPQQYATIKAMLDAQGMGQGLPPTFGPAAVEVLNALEARAVSVEEKLKLAMEERRTRATEASAGATSANAAANVRLTNIKAEIATDLRDRVRQNGGPRDPAAMERDASVTRLNNERADALTAQKFPRVPLDLTRITVGNNYTAADNKTKVRAVADPAGQYQAKDAAGKTVRFSFVPVTQTSEDLSADDQALIMSIIGAPSY